MKRPQKELKDLKAFIAFQECFRELLRCGGEYPANSEHCPYKSDVMSSV